MHVCLTTKQTIYLFEFKRKKIVVKYKIVYGYIISVDLKKEISFAPNKVSFD